MQTTSKKESPIKKEKPQFKDDFDVKDVSIEREKEDEKAKTLEKDKDYEDCTDLVLVEDKEDPKQAKEDRSLSPNTREKLLAIRPGTSPVVQRVHKSDYNKIGYQIREYQNKLKEIKALQELDGNSFDNEYGTAEIQKKRPADRSQSSNRATAELIKMGDPRSSHDMTQFTKAT